MEKSQISPDIDGMDFELTSERAKYWVKPKPSSLESTDRDAELVEEGVQLVDSSLLVQEASGHIAYPPATDES